MEANYLMTEVGLMIFGQSGALEGSGFMIQVARAARLGQFGEPCAGEFSFAQGFWVALSLR